MKWIIPGLLATTLIAGAAVSHPTDIKFDTRGECESAYAKSSKLDRERLVEMGVVSSKGAAQRTFNETFVCEYDEDEDGWFIVFLGFPEF